MPNTFFQLYNIASLIPIFLETYSKWIIVSGNFIAFFHHKTSNPPFPFHMYRFRFLSTFPVHSKISIHHYVFCIYYKSLNVPIRHFGNNNSIRQFSFLIHTTMREMMSVRYHCPAVAVPPNQKPYSGASNRDDLDIPATCKPDKNNSFYRTFGFLFK
ncbi:hypothetical protein D3C87_326660 [compost metagenome]